MRTLLREKNDGLWGEGR